MRTRSNIFLLVLFVCLSMTVSAQTVVWQLPPTDYSQITRYFKDIYQVEKNGKIGLIHSDGKVIVPTVCERITDFCNHIALVVSMEGNDELIHGFLTDRGNYIPLSQKYYTLKGQEFFSDGMLSVKNDRGKVGYLDEQGREALGFDGKYDKIKPFSEGYAAVFKNKNYSLIDKGGGKATFIIGIGEIYGGTNVYQGSAYVWDTDGHFYTYDTATGKCKSAKKPSNVQWDYLYCFTGVSGRGKTAPFSKLTSSGTIGLKPVNEGGLYGYQEGNKIVLPCQLAEATPFEDGLAVVKLNGKYGILRYVSQAKDFALSIGKSNFVYDVGQSVDCAFALDTPDEWGKNTMQVMVKDKSSGTQQSIIKTGRDYSFNIKPESSSSSYDVVVSAEGLLLWKGTASYTFKKIERNLQASISIKGHIADENDHVYVTAIISNPGSEEVTATVTLSGSNAFSGVTKTCTVGPKSSVSVSSYFTVKKHLDGQYARVHTSKGGSAQTPSISLEPYY